MTTLRYLYIDSVDVKTICMEFQVTKRLLSVNVGRFRFPKSLVDALVNAGSGPQINDIVQVDVTCADGTNVTEFFGAVTKITPQGRFVTIEARANARHLVGWRNVSAFTSSSLETVFESIAENGTSLFYSNISGTSSGITLTSFAGMGQDSLTLLKRLCNTSVTGTNPMWVFYQDGSDQNTIIWDRYGRNATGITLVVGTDIVAPVEYSESLDELMNDVTVIYSGGTKNESDSTSVSTYGTRANTIHAYYIDNSTDAGLLADKFLWDYKNPRILVKAKVKHDSLNSGTYYDVLNQTYSFTDATIGKTGAGPYTCIEHKINYPGFVDDITLGSVYQDSALYQKSLERRIAELERTRISIYATDTLRHSHDTEVTETSTSPVKKKTFTFDGGVYGMMRVKYDMKSLTGSEVSCIFKKNGTTIATMGAGETSTGYVTHSEDEYFSFESGDTLEVWLSVVVSGTAYLRNVRLYYDFTTSKTLSGVTTS